MEMCFSWIILVSISFEVALGQVHQVDTPVGTILGSFEDVALHTAPGVIISVKFVQYLGIPYAEPPVGELRFKKPVHKARLDSPHNGTFYRPICHQGVDLQAEPIINIQTLEISEDCLTLDIYAPIGSTVRENVYPVIVVIHGGSFVAGGSNGLVGDALSAYGQTVVVVINFRLAVMGFFSTGDSYAPGNYGLWDQQLAIQWSKQNIAAFGGDVGRITVHGFSSGSASALLQAMYPPNQGLFQRVIAESGSPIPTYKISSFLGKATGTDVAEAMLCKMDSTVQVVACMRGKTLSEIDDGLRSVGYNISFTPVIDGEFIVREPEAILTSTDPDTEEIRNMFTSIDLLVGVNKHDGGAHVTFLWAPLLNQDFNVLDVNRTVFDEILLPTALKLFLGNVTDTVKSVVQFQYTNSKDPDNALETRRNLVDLSSDIDFFIPAIKTANFHSSSGKNKSTYFYQFSSTFSLVNPLTPSWFNGSNYGDEVYFWLGFSQRNREAWSHLVNFVPTEAERALSRRMMTWWANFAASGNPNKPVNVPSVPEWTQYDNKKGSYLDIDLHTTALRDRLREPFASFWLNVVPSVMALSDRRCDSDKTTNAMPVACDSNIFSERFHLSGIMADNVITILIIASGTFLLGFIIVCSLAVARFNSETYDVKTI